jgi:hypothetical protein
MIPDVLVPVIFLVGLVYVLDTLVGLYLTIREYRESKKVDLKNEGLSAYIR